jgi:dTDP-4-dehydrorhamnose 3,5-epimerase
MRIEPLAIEGCFLVHGKKANDARGWFWKTFEREEFLRHGLDFECRETFLSLSVPGVLRGMHFQVPPKQHAKLVTCVTGRAFDVLLDLRKNSPGFGRSLSIDLHEDSGVSVFVPAGVAHGFCAPGVQALMSYHTSVPYDPACDLGIRWDSFGMHWPLQDRPILSHRDAAFPAFDQFATPF